MIDLAADNSIFFQDFAETVTYRPVDGRPRSILAVVDRNPQSMFGDVGQTPTMIVMVKNDPATGISSKTVNTSQDQIDVSERSGETATSRKIARIIQHDEGVMRLEVR